jgi:hypothetical protein
MENIIKCEGFSIENLYFEEFTLQNGGYISIDFSEGHDGKVEMILYEIFSGKRKMSGVLTSAQIIPIISPVVGPGPAIFFNRTAGKFLKEQSLFSDEDTIDILKEMDINPKISIYSLGANERKLLSLEAAYSKTKNIIICTSGLDYTGLEKVRNRIQKERHIGSVLEINYPTSKGRDYLFDASQSSHKNVKEILVR